MIRKYTKGKFLGILEMEKNGPDPDPLLEERKEEEKQQVSGRL